MARRGDGIYQRGPTWWLDFTHEGQQHITRLEQRRDLAGDRPVDPLPEREGRPGYWLVTKNLSTVTMNA